MKKTLVLFSIFFVLAGCSDKTTDEVSASISLFHFNKLRAALWTQEAESS